MTMLSLKVTVKKDNLQAALRSAKKTTIAEVSNLIACLVVI
jgi:hypothetical protein